MRIALWVAISVVAAVLLILLIAVRHSPRAQATPGTPRAAGAVDSSSAKEQPQPSKKVGSSPSPSKSTQGKSSVETMEHILFDDPERSPIVREFTDEMLAHMIDERKKLGECTEALRLATRGSKAWDFEEIVTIEGDGERMKVTDLSSENWPEDWTEEIRKCWSAVHVGYSYPSENKVRMTFSSPTRWYTMGNPELDR